MSRKISNHDQKNQNRFHIRNSRIQKFQKAYKRETARHNHLCYFMNKKSSVTFKRSQKCKKKQSKKTQNQQTEEKDIELIINIRKTKIQALVNNVSDISYMNLQLQKSLKIKSKNHAQTLII